VAHRPKREPDQETGWNVYRISGKGNRYIGHVTAKDEAGALKEALKVLTIPAALRDRILVKRND
jgi:hypothetical protein